MPHSDDRDRPEGGHEATGGTVNSACETDCRCVAGVPCADATSVGSRVGHRELRRKRFVYGSPT